MKTKVSTLSLILSILDSADRKKLVLCTLGILVVGFLDVLGLASLIPLVSIIVEPENWTKIPILSNLLVSLNVSSISGVYFIFLIATPTLFLLKNSSILILEKFVLKWVFNVSQKISERQVKRFYSRGYEYLVMNNTFKTNFKTIMLPLQFGTVCLRALMRLITEISMLLTVVMITALVSLKIMLVVVAVSLPTALIIFALIHKKIVDIGVQKNEYSPKNSEWLHKLLDSYVEFNVYKASHAFVEEYLSIQQKINDLRRKKYTAQLFPKRIFETVSIIGLCSLGAYYLIYLENPNGFIVIASVFALAVYRINPALINIVSSNIDLADSRNSIELLAENLTSDDTTMVDTPKFKMQSHFEFSNLSFTYGNNEVFSNVNLSITKGDSIGISGDSGVGKSTLGKIILGFIKPSKGSIAIDGKIIQSEAIDPTQFGYISAHTNLLNSGVHENVALDLHPSQDQIIRVKKCLVWSHLSEFTDNNKQVGLNGQFLSTGQQQRIALARALYFQPHFLVLDEYTANLDSLTEAGIIENIKQIQKEFGLTIIVFSHKESALSIANKRFELNKNGLKPLESNSNS